MRKEEAFLKSCETPLLENGDWRDAIAALVYSAACRGTAVPHTKLASNTNFAHPLRESYLVVMAKGNFGEYRPYQKCAEGGGTQWRLEQDCCPAFRAAKRLKQSGDYHLHLFLSRSFNVAEYLSRPKVGRVLSLS